MSVHFLLRHTFTSDITPKAIESLSSQQDLQFEIFDRVVTEPTEDSWREAIAWSRKHDFSHFLAYVA